MDYQPVCIRNLIELKKQHTTTNFLLVPLNEGNQLKVANSLYNTFRKMTENHEPAESWFVNRFHILLDSRLDVVFDASTF